MAWLARTWSAARALVRAEADARPAADSRGGRHAGEAATEAAAAPATPQERAAAAEAARRVRAQAQRARVTVEPSLVGLLLTCPHCSLWTCGEMCRPECPEACPATANLLPSHTAKPCRPTPVYLLVPVYDNPQAVSVRAPVARAGRRRSWSTRRRWSGGGARWRPSACGASSRPTRRLARARAPRRRPRRLVRLRTVCIRPWP